MARDHDDDRRRAPRTGGGAAPASTRALLSWALYDWANSSFPTIIQTFVFATYFTRAVAADPTAGTRQWGTALAIAALVVAVAAPLLGATTDQTGRRKAWVGGCTVVTVVATALLWLVEPSPEWVGPALALLVLGTVGFELASLLYNAMLPALADPARLGRWSGWGWGLGYAGGLVSLVLALVLFINDGAAVGGLDRAASEHVRATFVLAAVWYAVFALPLFLFTPDRSVRAESLGRGLRDGVRQLADTVRQARRYAGLIRFLVAHLFYVDGLATLFAFGGVYAAGTFDMDERDVLLYGIALNVTSGLGAAGFAWIDDWIGSRRTILVSLAGLVLAGTALLFIEGRTLFWTLGMVLGVFVGPAQASSRAYLARVAPPALANQMFGLYAFSGKATAFIGPLMVGWLTHASGSQRVGMSAIVLLLVVGLGLMLTVPEGERDI